MSYVAEGGGCRRWNEAICVGVRRWRSEGDVDTDDNDIDEGSAADLEGQAGGAGQVHSTFSDVGHDTDPSKYCDNDERHVGHAWHCIHVLCAARWCWKTFFVKVHRLDHGTNSAVTRTVKSTPFHPVGHDKNSPSFRRFNSHSCEPCLPLAR